MEYKTRLRQGAALLAVIDIQGKLVSAMDRSEELIPACVKLITGCRILGTPLLISEQYPKGLGPTLPEILEASRGDGPDSEPTLIEKLSFSVMGEPNFAAAVESESAKTKTSRPDIIICGIESHVCVMQSALDMMEAGHRVYVAADGVSSRTPMDRKYALQRMAAAGAVISTAESILFELTDSAANPAFKEISKLVR